MHNTARKKRARTGKICISCMVLVLAVILSFQIVRLHNQDVAYQEQEEQLETELAAEEQRADDLQQQEEYVGTDEYVEDVARSKLGMVYPDEILFKEE
ncbi:MAG: septum formation initiator family protein [Lachnospiraceae bacterium]|nr:septum formation initiator family protein [Lachnospiraceae bacterium]